MAAQLEHKTHKVAEAEIGHGYTLQVIRDYTRKKKPLLMYVAYYDGGWRRRKLLEFDKLETALRHMARVVEEGVLP